MSNQQAIAPSYYEFLKRPYELPDDFAVEVLSKCVVPHQEVHGTPLHVLAYLDLIEALLSWIVRERVRRMREGAIAPVVFTKVELHGLVQALDRPDEAGRAHAFRRRRDVGMRETHRRLTALPTPLRRIAAGSVHRVRRSGDKQKRKAQRSARKAGR